MTATVTADLYLRKSSADGGRSVEQQDEETTAGVLEQGWTAGRRFTDDARSASRYASRGRPDFTALLAHIRAGLCAVLAVWEASRASRRESTYFELLEACRDAGTSIYVHTHGRTYDPQRRSDWKALAREALDAADYSAAISESTVRGKRMRAQAGLPDGGPQIDGYRTLRNDKGESTGREEDPVRGPIIRRIIAAASANVKSHTKIADELNAEGLRTLHGKLWQYRDVTRIATNPAYAGLRIHRPLAQPGKPRPETRVYEGNWPALVERDVHEALVARLSDPSRRKQHGCEPVWLVSGIARHESAKCNGFVRATTAGRKPSYHCPECNGLGIDAVKVDAFVGDVALAYLRDKRAGALFRKPANDAEVQAVGREIETLSGRLSRFRQQAMAGQISPESFAEFEAGLLPLIEDAKRRQVELSMPPALARLGGAKRIVTDWAGYDVSTRREIVRRIMTVTILPAAYRGAPFSEDRIRIEPSGL